MPTIREIFNEKEALLDKSLNSFLQGDRSKSIHRIQEALFGQLALLEESAHQHGWDAEIVTLDLKTHLEATSIPRWIRNNSKEQS